MENILLLDSPIYFSVWVVLPLLIFTMRIFDVSLGTFRMIFISRVTKYLSAIPTFQKAPKAHTIRSMLK